MSKIYRQGDVALIVVKRPTNLQEAEKGAEILALGEHSGHGHVALNCDVMIAEDKKYLMPTKKGAKVKHMILVTGANGDHEEIDLPVLEDNLIYEVVIQNEFNPFSKVLEQVID